MTVQHEADILRAIACGINAHDLQRMDPWTGAEVAEVIETPQPRGHAGRHHRPVRDADAQAVGAVAVLAVKLAEVLGSARAGERGDDLRRYQRNALNNWLVWLRQAETEANREKRRLAQSSPRSRAQKEGA